MSIDYAQLAPWYVSDWKDQIKKYAERGDYDAAHQEQDALAEAALRAIAAGSPHAQEMAAIVVEVFEMDFDRYYA